MSLISDSGLTNRSSAFASSLTAKTAEVNSTPQLAVFMNKKVDG